MAFKANFTAIDFETANRRRDSACQLAAVVVRDGEIADEKMWMIRPDPFFFSPGNIRIHGIHPGDVEHEAVFGDRWNEIAEFLGDDCLIAHNAPFDIGVLMGCLERHRIAIPELHFSCTRLIARQTWPDRRRFGLKPLSDWLGVQFRHHDALEDSRACAKVLLAAGIAKSATSIEDLEKRLRILRGKAGDWGVSHASKIGRNKRAQGSSQKQPRRRVQPGTAKRLLRHGQTPALPLPMNPFDEAAMTRESVGDYRSGNDLTGLSSGQPENESHIDWQRLTIRAEFIQPLRGKCIVIRGQLKQLTIAQVAELARRGGGLHQRELNQSTNCILVGPTGVDADEIDGFVKTGNAEVISESEFLARIGA